MADRHIFRGLNSIKFNQRFKQEEDCLRYLAEVKWSDGYNCRRCSNDKFGTGKNFKELHIHVMNIKGWLRGIHHHCSKERMQNYLDEYHFRYNRRSNMDTIFDVLIRKMVNNELSY